MGIIFCCTFGALIDIPGYYFFSRTTQNRYKNEYIELYFYKLPFVDTFISGRLCFPVRPYYFTYIDFKNGVESQWSLLSRKRNGNNHHESITLQYLVCFTDLVHLWTIQANRWTTISDGGFLRLPSLQVSSTLRLVTFTRTARGFARPRTK